METLDKILADVKKIASDNNYEGATVDALSYLIASGIYKNEMTVLNSALELSQSTCTLLNSAIQHAQDKMYSVYRGKNQRIKIKYAKSLETKEVKRFDTCTRIGKYKLVYANDYKLTSDSETFAGEIELILCEDVIEETIAANLKKYIRSISTDITEDLELYINGKSTSYAKDINIRLNKADNGTYICDNNYINQTSTTPYLVLTDTDFGIVIWCYDSMNPELVFDTNYVYKIKSPKYLEDTIDTGIIKSIPGFDITESKNKADGITSYINLKREENVDNIRIESCAAEHSGNIIRSVNDIKNIFINYFGEGSIKTCKCYIDNAKSIINIVYLLNDKNASISDIDLEGFQNYLAKAFYVQYKVVVTKAWGYKVGDYNNFEYEDNKITTCDVNVVFDDFASGESGKTVKYTVNSGSYFTLPNGVYTKAGKQFVGWSFAGNNSTGYGINGNGESPAKVLITNNTTFNMVWADEKDTLRYIDLIYEKTKSNEDFYQRIYLYPDEDGAYKLKYFPPELTKENYTFAGWENASSKTRTTSLTTLSGETIVTNLKYIACWNQISYNITFNLTSKEIAALTGIAANNYSVVSQNVLSGNIFTEPNTPAELMQLGYRLAGWYWCENFTEDGDGEKGLTRYKFDKGTPIRQNFTLTAMYERDYDLDLEIYFDAPLNNTDIHTFVNEYSYNIGETFEPMKVATQLSKNFDGISWVDLKSTRTNVSIPEDSYYDFSFNITFHNEDTNKVR